jgi:hypothetical protein
MTGKVTPQADKAVASNQNSKTPPQRKHASKFIGFNLRDHQFEFANFNSTTERTRKNRPSQLKKTQPSQLSN